MVPAVCISRAACAGALVGCARSMHCRPGGCAAGSASNDAGTAIATATGLHAGPDLAAVAATTLPLPLLPQPLAPYCSVTLWRRSLEVSGAAPLGPARAAAASAAAASVVLAAGVGIRSLVHDRLEEAGHVAGAHLCRDRCSHAPFGTRYPRMVATRLPVHSLALWHTRVTDADQSDIIALSSICGSPDWPRRVASCPSGLAPTHLHRPPPRAV